MIKHFPVWFYILAMAVSLQTAMHGCTSKRGCIDPGSISYDPDARIDDGSCSYPSYSLQPLLFKKLDNKFSETSGLTYRDKKVWTIVDEMEENKIYSVDLLNGNAKEVLEAKGVSAVDFEAVTSSETHFYIADIGNNDGNRTDLTIYKIPIPDAYDPVNLVSYETITFNYPEQTDFRKNSSSNYDAESLIHFGDHLYILTKNHQDLQTVLYEIPDKAGDYDAKIKGIFDTKGLITDAAISPKGDKMVMLGYNKTSDKTYMWVLSQFSGSSFFSGKKVLVDLGPMSIIGQVEGIAFHNDNNVFISNEQYGSVDANIYYLDISSVQ